MNIVIKLVAVKITESWTFYNDTCKLSEDDGKHTGKPEVIRRFMEALEYERMKGVRTIKTSKFCPFFMGWF